MSEDAPEYDLRTLEKTLQHSQRALDRLASTLNDIVDSPSMTHRLPWIYQ